MTWAKCLSQCLNTSKLNKDGFHHNKKDFSAPPAASQGSPGWGKVWDVSHQSKTNPTAIPPSEKDQNRGGGGGRQRDVIKSHWPEALKYERGSKAAQSWGLCSWENPAHNNKKKAPQTHPQPSLDTKLHSLNTFKGKVKVVNKRLLIIFLSH